MDTKNKDIETAVKDMVSTAASAVKFVYFVVIGGCLEFLLSGFYEIGVLSVSVIVAGMILSSTELVMKTIKYAGESVIDTYWHLCGLWKERKKEHEKK